MIQVIAYKRKAATRQLKKLFDEEKYEEFARLYIPDLVMDKETIYSLDNFNTSILLCYYYFNYTTSPIFYVHSLAYFRLG